MPEEQAKPAQPARRLSKEEELEQGRVWEGEIGEDVQRRFEAVAKEKGKDRGKGRLIGKLAACAPMKVGKSKTR